MVSPLYDDKHVPQTPARKPISWGIIYSGIPQVETDDAFHYS